MTTKKRCRDCGEKTCPNFCEWCGHCDCIEPNTGQCIKEEPRWLRHSSR